MCRSPRGGFGSPFIALLGRNVMYGTRFKRRAVSRPESMLGGRSRRRLLMRPAAYAILATAVCLAAATLPSSGKNDTAKAAAGPVGSGFTVTPADLAFILKQIKIAERHSRAFQGNPDPGDPGQPRSDRRPGLLPVDGRPECEPDPGPAHHLRPAHGRWIVQQPVPGPREVRGRGPAVPAPDDPGLQRSREHARRASVLLGPSLVRAEEGQRLRLAAPR